MATNPSIYKLNHSMMRIKDPKRSLKFYELLGMKQLNKLDFPSAKFDLYMLGYDNSTSISQNVHWTNREGCLELRHEYGTEDDPAFKVSNGNEEPKGFGHICITVDNIQAACQRLEEAGCKFQKRLLDGNIKTIAFLLDPDGYWIEIVSQTSAEETTNIQETNSATYRMNHTAFRVKDVQKSLSFYEEVFGLTLTRTLDLKEVMGTTHHFLNYNPHQHDASGNVIPNVQREGILELIWDCNQPTDQDFSYHSGNSNPVGFGHICFTVDDINAACERFENLGVEWQTRLGDGAVPDMAFARDPDGYWIEILPNKGLKKK